MIVSEEMCVKDSEVGQLPRVTLYISKPNDPHAYYTLPLHSPGNN